VGDSPASVYSGSVLWRSRNETARAFQIGDKIDAARRHGLSFHESRRYTQYHVTGSVKPEPTGRLRASPVSGCHVQHAAPPALADAVLDGGHGNRAARTSGIGAAIRANPRCDSASVILSPGAREPLPDRHAITSCSCRPSIFVLHLRSAPVSARLKFNRTQAIPRVEPCEPERSLPAEDAAGHSVGMHGLSAGRLAWFSNTP
jgi:hypothetical protein